MSKFSALRLYTWIAPSLVVVGCASDPGSEPTPITTATAIAELAPDPSSYTIDASVGGTINGQGTSFVIPAGAVFVPGGQPANIDTDGDGVPDSRRVTGKVKVTLRELLSAEDMAAAGRPTVTSGGELLETGGAFDLTIQSNGEVVQVTELRNLRIKPAVPPSSGDGMELWLANANAPGEFGWNRPPGGAVKAEPAGSGFGIPVVPSGRINRPTTSKNIDKPRPPIQTAGPIAPVSVQLAATAADDAAVFFFPAGIASVVRLERDATGAYTAPASVMHADLTGRLVAISVTDGRYFYQDRTVSLADTRSFAIDLVEITRDELRARLGAR